MLWACFIPFYKRETYLPKAPDLVRASACLPPLGGSVAAWAGRLQGKHLALA